MTFPEAVIRPIARIITHTTIWVWSVFMLLAWLGSRRLRISILSLRLRQPINNLAPVQSTSRSFTNQG